MRGQVLPIISREQGVGRGLQPLTAAMNAFSKGAGGSWHTTYTAVPQFVSTHQRGLFLDTSDYVIFDFSASQEFTFAVNASAFDAHLLLAPTPLDLVEEYSSIVGRMPQVVPPLSGQIKSLTPLPPTAPRLGARRRRRRWHAGR